MNIEYIGNSLFAWLTAVVVFFLLIIVLSTLNSVLKYRIKKHSEKIPSDLDELIYELLNKTSFLIIVIFSFYVGTQFLEIGKKLESLRNSLVIIALLIQVALWGGGVITYVISKKLNKYTFEAAGSAITQIKVIGFLSRIALWTIIFLLIIANLGFDITALIAGLGIGGIAVALALQNVLGDLIASLSIVLDKPFVVGDFIIVDDMLGNVEHVGLKTTRVRALSGEQLVFANTDLLGSRVRNFKRMFKRRIVFTIGVVYGTPVEKLERIPQMIKDIIEEEPKADFDRSHFAEYGDFSLNIETVYYVTVPEYNVYMDTQQSINLKLYRQFKNEGIEFAYPTQTLFLKRDVTPVADDSNIH